MQLLNSNIVFQGRTEAIYKVIVIADPAVGKTSLLTKFAKNQFKERYLSTVGVNILKEPINLDENTVANLMFWDVAGQPQFSMLHRPYFNGANGVIFTFNLSIPSSFSKLKFWNKNVINYGLQKIPHILLGIKNDVHEKERIKLHKILEISNYMNAPYFKIILSHSGNLKYIFKYLAINIYRYLSSF